MKTQDCAQPSVPSTKNTPLQHVKRKGPWLVVCITGRLDTQERAWLAPGKNPRAVHPTLKSAAEEAIRLAQLFNDQFAIMECIGVVSK